MKSISVIIPVYNCKAYLERCVASVINVNDSSKTLLIREIILVDDGSTDGSSALCDAIAIEMSSKTCSIRIQHQENAGVSAARNTGLKMASGTFVLFVDSDDTIDGEKLAQLLQVVDQDESIDMAVYGMSFDYYAGEKIYRQSVMLPPVSGKMGRESIEPRLYQLYISNALSSLCNRLIRRSLITGAGLLLNEDMILFEDLEFSLRVLALCDDVFFYPEPVYHYRQALDEGNAFRRLREIEHVSEVVEQIDGALKAFSCDRERLLLTIYLTLARGKINSASGGETAMICEDFRMWVDVHDMRQSIANNKYALMLYNKQIPIIYAKNLKTKIRHNIANFVKKRIGVFRKL